MRKAAACLVLVMIAAGATGVSAQALPKGYVSLFTDYFPQQNDAVELRARVFAEEHFEPSRRVTVDVSGFAEGLVARRALPQQPVQRQTVEAGIVRIHDANVLLSGERADVLVGYARVAWGKLDEIQPTDVVNPLDVSRFFFEGRGEAGLPVLLLRGRWHLRPNLTVEGIYVPVFRRGRFDRLNESTSPFTLPTFEGLATSDLEVVAEPTPPFRGSNLAFQHAQNVERQDLTPSGASAGQGGARLSTTTGRVDWSVSAYRGFEPFGMYQIVVGPTVAVAAPVVAARYPRFTMIGADLEAVHGKWGVRGEAAAFVEDSFQSADLRVVPGKSFDAGAGVDRRAGDYTVSATVLLHAERYDTPLLVDDLKEGRTDVSLIASADRTFAREKYRLRAFAVYNAVEQSAFLRVIGVTTLRDNVAMEASVGWFAGGGSSLVARFGNSDFVYARLKYYF